MVDNFAAHHGDAEVALRSFLNDVGMELLFLPAYSPDLNPDEEVFSKLKYLLKYQYQDIVFEKLEYAVCTRISFILLNRPFPSFCEPHYESEAKCKTFHMKISFVCI